MMWEYLRFLYFCCWPSQIHCHHCGLLPTFITEENDTFQLELNENENFFPSQFFPVTNPLNSIYKLGHQVEILLFFLFFCLHPTAWRILVPWPGIEPGPCHWKRGVLTTGLPGNSWDPILRLCLWGPGWSPVLTHDGIFSWESDPGASRPWRIHIESEHVTPVPSTPSPVRVGGGDVWCIPPGSGYLEGRSHGREWMRRT